MIEDKRKAKVLSDKEKVFNLMLDGRARDTETISKRVGCNVESAGAHCRAIRKEYMIPLIKNKQTGANGYILLLDADGQPIRQPNICRQPAGLKAWACKDDNGAKRMFLISSIQPNKKPTNNTGVWTFFTMQFSHHLINATFPKGIERGQCVEVILPRAVIVKDSK